MEMKNNFIIIIISSFVFLGCSNTKSISSREANRFFRNSFTNFAWNEDTFNSWSFRFCHDNKFLYQVTISTDTVEQSRFYIGRYKYASDTFHLKYIKNIKPDSVEDYLV